MISYFPLNYIKTYLPVREEIPLSSSILIRPSEVELKFRGSLGDILVNIVRESTAISSIKKKTQTKKISKTKKAHILKKSTKPIC